MSLSLKVVTHVKVKIIWIAVQRGISFYTWCPLLIFGAERKCLVRKLCSEEQHPPWSYPILFVLCCHWTMLIWRLCEWKYVIVNLLGRVYQAVKMMTLPGNKKPKENQKRKCFRVNMNRFWGSTETVTPVGSYAMQCPCQFPMQFASLSKHCVKRFT